MSSRKRSSSGVGPDIENTVQYTDVPVVENVVPFTVVSSTVVSSTVVSSAVVSSAVVPSPVVPSPVVPSPVVPSQAGPSTVVPSQAGPSEVKYYTCIAILVCTMVGPFVACDLYWSFSDITCQNTPTRVGITLRKWLMVDGFLILSILFCTMSAYTFEIAKHFVVLFLAKIYKMFGIIWFIVGGVLIWRDLDNCSEPLHDYVQARVILGLLSYAYNLVKS